MTNTQNKPARNRKRLVRTVDLRFFQDDANGEFGVTHKDTCPGNGNGDEFNAFWDGRGIFHDVFEHAHEFTDKHFRGQYALTTAGETVAMGALLYYIGAGRVYRNQNERGSSFYTEEQQAVMETADAQAEMIKSGNERFTSSFDVCVPNQPDTEDSSLEWAIDEHWQRIVKAKAECGQGVWNQPGKGQDPEELARCKEYADSVTEEKIRNLYRYGWHMAQKLVGDVWQNGNTLSNFISFWNDFCKKNSAEELTTFYKGIVFKIYKDREGLLSWSATFEPKHAPSYEAAKKFVIRSNGELPDVFNVFDSYPVGMPDDES